MKCLSWWFASRPSTCLGACSGRRSCVIAGLPQEVALSTPARRWGIASGPLPAAFPPRSRSLTSLVPRQRWTGVPRAVPARGRPATSYPGSFPTSVMKPVYGDGASCRVRRRSSRSPSPIVYQGVIRRTVRSPSTILSCSQSYQPNNPRFLPRKWFPFGKLPWLVVLTDLYQTTHLKDHLWFFQWICWVAIKYIIGYIRTQSSALPTPRFPLVIAHGPLQSPFGPVSFVSPRLHVPCVSPASGHR